MITLLTQLFDGDGVHRPRTQAAAVVAATSTVYTSRDHTLAYRWRDRTRCDRKRSWCRSVRRYKCGQYVVNRASPIHLPWYDRMLVAGRGAYAAAMATTPMRWQLGLE